MSRKTREKKMRLGANLKRSRRLPPLASIRTHRRLQMNLFKRDWRRTKLKLK